MARRRVWGPIPDRMGRVGRWLRPAGSEGRMWLGLYAMCACLGLGVMCTVVVLLADGPAYTYLAGAVLFITLTFVAVAATEAARKRWQVEIAEALHSQALDAAVRLGNGLTTEEAPTGIYITKARLDFMAEHYLLAVTTKPRLWPPTTGA